MGLTRKIFYTGLFALALGWVSMTAQPLQAGGPGGSACHSFAKCAIDDPERTGCWATIEQELCEGGWEFGYCSEGCGN